MKKFTSLALNMAAPSRSYMCVTFHSKTAAFRAPLRKLVLIDTSKTLGEFLRANAPTGFTVHDIQCATSLENSDSSPSWIETKSDIGLDTLVQFGICAIRANDAPAFQHVALPTANALDMLMQNRQKVQSLPEPKVRSSGVAGNSGQINNKDRLYNDLLTVFREKNWLFSDLVEGAYVIQRITDALWTISGHEKTIAAAHDHDPQVHAIPPMFNEFADYNKRRDKRKLSNTDIKSQSELLISLVDRPSISKHLVLVSGLKNFAECLRSYEEYLRKKLQSVQSNHSLEHPVRLVSEHLKAVHLKRRQTVLPKYQILNRQLMLLSEWGTLLFDELKHLEKPFQDRHERFRFLDGMELSHNVVLLKYCPGGVFGSVVHLVKLPVAQSTKNAQETNIARIVAELTPKLPEFHTRAMKRSFKHRISNIATISPAVLSLIYKETSGDASAPENLLMQQRLRLAAEGEPGIVADLRHLNPGRPAGFDVFWTEAKKLLNEISAADERRRASGATSDAHMSEFISYPDLQRRIADRCPPDTPIPSISTLRLATSPTNPYAATAQAFTGILDVKHKVQVRQLRVSHPDAHFCAAQFRYLRQRAADLQDVFMVFLDDKAKIPLGEPGIPVSTNVRTKSTLTPGSTDLNACDHDVDSKGKLTPTVILIPVIPTDFEDSWYQGETTIVLHDSILQPSNAYQNAALLIREYRRQGASQRTLMKFSDGGSEHRSIFIKVQLSYIAMMHILDLDLIVAARCAPHQSWMNPVERINSIANLALQNVSTSRSRCSEDVENKLKSLKSMDDIRKRAKEDEQMKQQWQQSIQRPTEVIGDRLSRLSLKGKQFCVDEPVPEEGLLEVMDCLHRLFPRINPNDVTKKNAMKDDDIKNYFEQHTRERNYVFQARKKKNCGCCGEIRSANPDLDLEWLPDPILDEDKKHYKKLHEVLGTETSDVARPGNQPQFKAGGKLDNPFMQQAHEENMKDTSTYNAHCARALAICAECGKPRVVHAKSLTKQQKKKLEDCLNELEYTCGSSCVPPDHELWEVVKMRLTLSCADPIEATYYSGKNCPGRKDICVICGAAEATVDLAMKTKFKIVRPNCVDCRAKGLTVTSKTPLPTTRKRKATTT